MYCNEKKFKKNYEYFVCILLSFTNPFGSVISIFWILAQARFSIFPIRTFWGQTWKVFSRIVPILTILLYFRMPKDSIFQPNFDLHPISFVRAFSAAFIKPFLPYEDTHKINVSYILLSVLIILLLLAVFMHVDSGIKFALLVAYSMLFLNALIGYSLYWWHFGASYLVFLLTFAIHYQRRAITDRSKFLIYSIGTILILQVCGSVIGPGKDFHGDSNYSNIRKTAEYISLRYPGYTVVSDSQIFGTSLYAYLKPAGIFFPSTGKFSYFTSWKSSEFRDLKEEELITAALKFENSIIVTSFFQKIEDPRVRMVRAFTGAVLGDDFQIYELIKSP